MRSLFFAMLLTTSCVEVIDFPTQKVRELSIYGKLTNATNHVPTIEIAYINRENFEKEAVESARVIVYEQSTPIPFIFNKKNGVYIPVAGKLIAKPETDYQLEISLGDSLIVSTIQRLPNGNLTSFNSQFKIERIEKVSSTGAILKTAQIKITVDAHLPDSLAYFRWDLVEVYLYTQMALPTSKYPFYFAQQCFITDENPVLPIPLFTSENNSVKEIIDFPIVNREIDETFEEIHYFGVVANTISKETFDYWQKVNSLVYRNGNLAEVPPAILPGNIYAKNNPTATISGFFEVNRVDTTSVYVLPEDIPFLVTSICPPFPIDLWSRATFNCVACLVTDFGIEESCINCTVLRNSSLVKPDFLP